ncbi:MAG: restriction endonuclease subunit S [Rhodocyclaceae bacterium]|nr:restriction endonuclease subunit S [Rhodocyclaceae bacterium]
MSVCLPDHIDLIAAAPGGIQKLRGLILELAVRGKLVAQDPKDEPASELLKRIAKERARLEAEGVCKKSKPLPPVGEDERPLALPSTWIWTRLGEVTNFGQTDKDGEISDNTWVLDLEDIEKDTSTLLRKVRYAERQAKSDKNRFLKGDVLYGKLRPYLNKVIVADEEGVCTTEILPVRGHCGIFPRYLMHAVKRPDFLSYVNSKSYGMKMPRLGTDDGRLAFFPLAPEPEQHRIVAKVDELMALCDLLEAEQADSASAHARLIDTLLATLTQSTDAADLATNWQRLAEHFDTLFTTEPSLDALKQTILQLAVMGKLVPQNLNDEPASELLKRIAKERAQLEADGVCKKSKPLPPVGDDEQQHSIPRTWKYVRLQEICSTITDGTHQTPKYTESGRPFLSAQNVKPFRFMPEFFRYVSEKDYQGYVKSSKPEFGDILLTRVGAMIGEAAVIDKQMDFAIYVSLALLKPCQPFVLPEFITLWLNSPFGTHSSIRDTLGRGVSAGNLNLSMIRAFAAPLPPISEQKRIVGKVGELMLLCDRLKIDFVAARQHQATLADSLIDSALEAT